MTVNKRVRNAVLGCNLKNDRMISVRFQGKLLNIMVIQVYASTSNTEEAEVDQCYEDLQNLELTLKIDVLFIIGDWNAKVGSQEIAGVTGKFGLGSTEWSKAKANRVLPRECTVHSKHPLPTTQEKTLHMDITRWLAPKSDWLYFLQPRMEKLCTVSKNKTRSWLWITSWTPYCQIQTETEASGENHYTIHVLAKWNPYDYSVEVRNRFKGLDLIDRVPVRDTVQETGIKTIPKKKNAKKQNGCLRRPYK